MNANERKEEQRQRAGWFAVPCFYSFIRVHLRTECFWNEGVTP